MNENNEAYYNNKHMLRQSNVGTINIFVDKIYK